MAIGKFKIYYKPQTYTWINPQIKTHKKSYELRLIRPQTLHKNPEHNVFKIFNIHICGENCEISWVQVNYKQRNINVLFTQYRS